ncbi:MAG: GNAT family N-acetyltransferase [Gemmataceae bacterium]|nr:GNAT family N-acetyltransferase [Gemmataceae bacterium]
MIRYRPFRNIDPPRLTEVWNQCFVNRGAVQMRTSTPLERYVLSKPTFDPAGLILAEEEDGRCIGWIHAGIAPRLGEAAEGVVCMLGVAPTHRKQGVGSELLRQGEAYLQGRGARTIFAGSQSPRNPFYLGLYGGSECSGFLDSDPAATPFFLKHGYGVHSTTAVYDRPLEQLPKPNDARVSILRTKYEVQVGPPRKLDSFWHECTTGCIDPIAFIVEDKKTKKIVGRALVWEMEGFSYRWGKPSVGILGFEIADEHRQQGVGKLLLGAVLRQGQESFFELAEVQANESNPAAVKFLESYGFEKVDRGQTLIKKV